MLEPHVEFLTGTDLEETLNSPPLEEEDLISTLNLTFNWKNLCEGFGIDRGLMFKTVVAKSTTVYQSKLKELFIKTAKEVNITKSSSHCQNLKINNYNAQKLMNEINF